MDLVFKLYVTIGIIFLSIGLALMGARYGSRLDRVSNWSMNAFFVMALGFLFSLILYKVWSA